MNHDEMRERIALLGDAELPGSERRALEAHLAVCQDCRAARERWKKVASALAAAAQPPTPAETERFVGRVMARLPDPAPVPAPFLAPAFWRLPALGVAFAAALFLLTLGRRETVSTRSLLLADGSGGAALQSLLSDDTPLGFEAP